HGKERTLALLRGESNLPAKRASFHIFGSVTQSVGPFIQHGPVNLIGISQKYDLGTFSCSGNNPLHLIRRHILSLVNDQVGFYNRTAPDIIQCFSLDQSPLKNFLYFSLKLPLILIPLLFAGINKLLQIVNNWTHQRRDFFLLISRQKADIGIKLGIWA